MLGWFQHRVWLIFTTTVRNWLAHDGTLLSAAMAYYAAFSLFPLCLVLIAGLGFVSRFSPRFQDSQKELLNAVAQNTSPWLADQLGNLLERVQTNASVGGPVGLVVLIFGAIGVFVQLVNMVDRVWAIPQPNQQGVWWTVRTVLYDRGVAFLMLLTAGTLVLVVFVANLVLAGLHKFAVELPGGDYLWQASQLLFTFVFNSLLFTALYKTLPKATVPWLHALCGGLFTAVVWQMGQQLFALFVIGEKYSAYGVVGSFIALMVWAYYASAVVMLGAEFVQAISQVGRGAGPANSARSIR